MYWNEKIKDHKDINFLENHVMDKNIHSFPPKYKTLIPQHKADWIHLLMTYGVMNLKSMNYGKRQPGMIL